MTLIEHVISLIVAMPTVKAMVGRNPNLNDDGALAIRDGILHADDPYPSIVVDLQSQEHERDLSDRGGLIHATIAVRTVSFSKPQAWALRTAVAYDGGSPNDPARTSGLDGFKDIAGRAIWGIGLVSETTNHIDPTDGEDRAIWIVESIYQCDYQEQ